MDYEHNKLRFNFSFFVFAVLCCLLLLLRLLCINPSSLFLSLIHI